MQHALGRGYGPSIQEVLEFIKTWLVNHILVTDVEYGRYVAAKFY